MPEKVSCALDSRIRSCDLVILTFKKDHNPEKFNPYRPEVDVSALIA